MVPLSEQSLSTEQLIKVPCTAYLQILGLTMCAVRMKHIIFRTVNLSWRVSYWLLE